MLEGLRGEQSVSELCRREGIASNLYYRWSKDFLEAGKKRLSGDTVREATSDEVKVLRSENRELKEVVAEITWDPGGCGVARLSRRKGGSGHIGRTGRWSGKVFYRSFIGEFPDWVSRVSEVSNDSRDLAVDGPV